MGKYLLTKAKVMVDGHELTTHAFALDTPDEREQVDVSGFNYTTGTKEYLPGARDQTIEIQFLQGFGTAEPHRILQPLYEGGSAFPLSIVPDGSAAVGPNNPSFGGTASLYAYNGLSGELNNRGEITATFRPASASGFQWGTA